MKLIIGLGNPGKEYEKTWHNVGFKAIEEFRKIKTFEFSDFKLSKKFKAEICEGIFSDEKLILIKPQTFMNLSGQAVFALTSFYKIKPKDLWVIHDELDLPLGQIRISQNSSAGGHKGVQSIIDKVGTKNFVRFRLGIKPLKEIKIPAEAYVLKKIDKEDNEILQKAILKIISAIEISLSDNPDKAMNRFN